MAKATFVLEDKDGQVAMSIDFGPGTDKNSPAHKTAHILSQWMQDLMHNPTENPQVVIAAETIRAEKAASIAHIASEPVKIHAHGY